MNVLVICHQENNGCNGQIAKTNDVIEHLKKSGFDIDVLAYNKLNTIQKLLKSYKEIKKHDAFVLMPGGKSPLFFYTRMLSFLKKKNVHYVAIGGWVINLISDPKNKKIFNKMKSFKGIYLQNNKTVEAFNNNGFNNTYCIYSFSTKTPLSSSDINSRMDYLNNPNKEYKFCFYARVTKEKGALLACDAINKISNQLKDKTIKLDIYGEIKDPNVEAELKSITVNNPNIKVKGVLGDNAIKVLSNYYCMLFPTQYKGEGFPHSILESFMASLPVIATKWAYNEEIIQDKKTGLLFDCSVDNLADSIKWAIENNKSVIEMSKNCFEESKKYDISVLLKLLIDSLNN